MLAYRASIWDRGKRKRKEAAGCSCCSWLALSVALAASCSLLVHSFCSRPHSASLFPLHHGSFLLFPITSYYFGHFTAGGLTSSVLPACRARSLSSPWSRWPSSYSTCPNYFYLVLVLFSYSPPLPNKFGEFACFCVLLACCAACLLPCLSLPSISFLPAGFPYSVLPISLFGWPPALRVTHKPVQPHINYKYIKYIINCK